MKIINNTTGVLQEADRLILKALEEVTPKIEATAKQTVIVKSGDLKDSITAEVSSKKAVIGSPLDYAPKVEMNKPFLRPALHGNIQNIRKAFRT